MKKVTIICVGIIFLLLVTCISSSNAIDNLMKTTFPISYVNTLYVGGSGEGNYTTIKSAVMDAKDGDTEES